MSNTQSVNYIGQQSFWYYCFYWSSSLPQSVNFYLINVGLSKSSTFKEGISDIQCSISMMLDDVVNGNVTTSGNFFIGVNPLITSINSLSTNIGSIQT